VLQYRQRREGNGFDPRFGRVLFLFFFFGTLGMKLLVIWCGVGFTFDWFSWMKRWLVRLIYCPPESVGLLVHVDLES
jgi:hypothetical protein